MANSKLQSVVLFGSPRLDFQIKVSIFLLIGKWQKTTTATTTTTKQAQRDKRNNNNALSVLRCGCLKHFRSQPWVLFFFFFFFFGAWLCPRPFGSPSTTLPVSPPLYRLMAFDASQSLPLLISFFCDLLASLQINNWTQLHRQ